MRCGLPSGDQFVPLATRRCHLATGREQFANGIEQSVVRGCSTGLTFPRRKRVSTAVLPHVSVSWAVAPAAVKSQKTAPFCVLSPGNAACCRMASIAHFALPACILQFKTSPRTMNEPSGVVPCCDVSFSLIQTRPPSVQNSLRYCSPHGRHGPTAQGPSTASSVSRSEG